MTEAEIKLLSQMSSWALNEPSIEHMFSGFSKVNGGKLPPIYIVSTYLAVGGFVEATGSTVQEAINNWGTRWAELINSNNGAQITT